jgi:2-oxoglutarate ferredoxin oxidoreductase subunit beta
VTATRVAIGLGQFCHAIRRNLNMAYIIENNGVYGLTKGQFSASADVGTKAKKGEVNQQPPIDPVLLALTLGRHLRGAQFLRRQTTTGAAHPGRPAHKGFALIDVLSPCVTFNDHEGSTKSYDTRASTTTPRCTRTSCRSSARSRRTTRGRCPARGAARRQPDTAAQARCELRPDRSRARQRAITERLKKGEFLTGLLYVDPTARSSTMSMRHRLFRSIQIPLNRCRRVGGSSESSGQISLAALCFGPL